MQILLPKRAVFRYANRPASLLMLFSLMLNTDALSQLRQLKQTIEQHKQTVERQKASNTGIVKASQGRYGFVVLDDGREIYLPPEQMLRVLPDDRVEIEVVANPEGKASATIEKLLSSTLVQLTGHYVVRDNAHFVEPDLPRFNRWLFVPPKMRGSAQHGDYVCARIARHPLTDGKAQARIERVIGNAAQSGVEARYALARFQLPTDALPLAADDLVEPDWQARRDLTALPFVTIDGLETLDMDDALYAQPSADGWQLSVAIADPSAWIKPGSKLEQEIAARATSIYLPGLTIPMLPTQLANERCALQADVERLALVCTIDIDRDGNIATYQFCEARIRSCARLSYDGVAEFLAADNSTDETIWAASVRALHEIADALRAQRQRAHIVMPERAEYRLVLDANGKVAAYQRDEKNSAQQLVEQCMVATNRCAADFLASERALFIRHDGFRSERRDIVAQLLAAELPQLPTNEVDQLAPYIALQNTLANNEFALPLRAILMRSLTRSQFSDRAAPHFGLGFAQYTTITSPIRKFNDFFLHRIIKAKLRNAALPTCSDALLAQLQDVGDRTRQASRLAEQWLNCEYLQQRYLPAADTATVSTTVTTTSDDSNTPQDNSAAVSPPTILHGEIAHVTSSGIVVRLLDNGIEGFVDTRHCGEKFSFDNVYMRLSSATRQFELEQRVAVTVSAIDLKRRSINFQLVADTTNATADTAQEISAVATLATTAPESAA